MKTPSYSAALRHEVCCLSFPTAGTLPGSCAQSDCLDEKIHRDPFPACQKAQQMCLVTLVVSKCLRKLSLCSCCLCLVNNLVVFTGVLLVLTMRLFTLSAVLAFASSVCPDVQTMERMDLAGLAGEWCVHRLVCARLRISFSSSPGPLQPSPLIISGLRLVQLG